MLTDHDRRILSSNSEYRRYPAAVRTAIATAGRVVERVRGQWVYGEGDSQAGLVFVLDGALRLEVAVGSDRMVMIGLLPAGGVIGQGRIGGGGPRLVTTRAQVASRLLLVSDAVLEELAKTHPGTDRAVSQLLYRQLDSAVHLLAHHLASRPQARIALRLLQCLKGGVVQATQADLAEMCGVSRKIVNRTLSVWEIDGLVRCGYMAIKIPDPASIAIIAGITVDELTLLGW